MGRGFVSRRLLRRADRGSLGLIIGAIAGYAGGRVDFHCDGVCEPRAIPALSPVRRVYRRRPRPEPAKRDFDFLASPTRRFSPVSRAARCCVSVNRDM